MTYNEFAAKHPILNLLLGWGFFAGMLYFAYIADGIGLTWCIILNVALALLVITGIVFMLDPKHKAKIGSYYKTLDKDNKNEKAQKRKEWNNKTTPEKIRAIWLKILGWIVCIAIGFAIVWYGESSGPNFACDETTVSEAQDLLNEEFPNLHGALKLSNPVTVKETENFIRCKANTNIDQVIYYNLKKQDDGILVIIDPIGDMLNEIDSAVQGALNELEYQYSID